jgi:hypothetical protein
MVVSDPSESGGRPRAGVVAPVDTGGFLEKIRTNRRITGYKMSPVNWDVKLLRLKLCNDLIVSVFRGGLAASDVRQVLYE